MDTVMSVDSSAESPETPLDAEPAEAKAAGSATKGRTRRQSTARKTRTVELILTVTGTADGEWQVDLVHQGERVVSALPVAASAVARAARELHPDVHNGIESVLRTAREQHQARLEQLEAELNQVRLALAELTD